MGQKPLLCAWSFNEAAAIAPRMWRFSGSPILGKSGFNEAAAIAPRMCRRTAGGRCTGNSRFNEPAAIAPRMSKADKKADQAFSASMRPRQLRRGCYEGDAE